MLGKFQSLIAPRYPRRYVGRHRARSAIRVASVVALGLGMASVGLTSTVLTSEQTAN